MIQKQMYKQQNPNPQVSKAKVARKNSLIKQENFCGTTVESFSA